MNKSKMIHPKNEHIRLSENLRSYEVQCRCNYEECTFFLFSNSLGYHFEILRKALGSIPLNINSGYRCILHQRDIGASSKTSRHCAGMALDIARPKEVPFMEFHKIAQAVFPFTLTYEHLNFIHCDIDYRK